MFAMFEMRIFRDIFRSAVVGQSFFVKIAEDMQERVQYQFILRRLCVDLLPRTSGTEIFHYRQKCSDDFHILRGIV